MINVIYLNTGSEIDFERSVLDRLGVKDINLVRIEDGGRGLPMDHYVKEYAAQGVALTFEPATAEVLARCPSLKIISFMAVGHDPVDLAAATSRGIVVTNVTGYCDEEVALHALTMAFDLDVRNVGNMGDLPDTLPMFLLFPWLLARLGFWPALLASALLTCACFGLTAWAVRPLGIRLLP